MALYLKMSEVMERTGLSKNTVYGLINSGLLKATKLKSMRVSELALMEFVKKYDGWDLSNPFNPVPLENVATEEDREIEGSVSTKLHKDC